MSLTKMYSMKESMKTRPSAVPLNGVRRDEPAPSIMFRKL